MVFGKRKLQDFSSYSDPLESHESSDEEDLSNHWTQTQRRTQCEESPVTESLANKASQRKQSKPLLDEIDYSNPIEIRDGKKNTGGSKHWRCKHCKFLFCSSYTRIYYHFFGAPVGKKSGIQRCSTLMKNFEEFERVKRRVMEAEDSGSVSPGLKKSIITKQKTPSSHTIEGTFRMMERAEVDLKIMRGLAANGIPFNVLRNPQFVDMVTAINSAPKGYKAPSFEKARTVLLDECKRSVEKELSPVKDTWYTQGVSIVSDGWTNVKNRPLINVLAVNSRGAMFMYAEDFSGIEKTGAAIAQYLLKAIEEVGASNVLQVVTDNASNCKAAGKEIEKVHKHIFWSPCVVHTLNLIFKDFAATFDWLNNTYRRGKAIVTYVLNHTHALAMFRENSQFELLKVAQTRFASHYILLKRLLDCREALATTIVLKQWKEWLKQGDENKRKMGCELVETISSEEFWEEAGNVVNITKPIFCVLRFSDGEGSKMGEIYEKMDMMLGEIKEIMKRNRHANDFCQMENIIISRWTKMNYSIHCLGFALSPKFYDQRYLQSPAPGGIARKAPNCDKEVVTGVMEAFEKIAEDEKEQKMLRDQFATFHMKRGIFAIQAAQTDAATMDAIDWWSTYGSETPELAEVAKKVLSQPISSSSAERNWSTYSYIHNVKRNRLNCSRADKLVFIHSNIRLQSRFCQSYKDGPYLKWDMDPEDASLEESSSRLQEIRWKSLDMEYVGTLEETEMVQGANEYSKQMGKKKKRSSEIV